MAYAIPEIESQDINLVNLFTENTYPTSYEVIKSSKEKD